MVGKKIKRLRLKKKMSLSSLSKISGVSKSYLSDLEIGVRNNPSIDIIKKIAKGLNTDILQLINRKSA